MGTSGTHLLGIDIGGTKTSVCVGTFDGRIRASRRFPTRADDPPSEWWSRLQAVLADLRAGEPAGWASISAVGVAAPGPMSVSRGMLLAPPNMPAWHDVPVVDWLRGTLPWPVFINNDANAAGLAEYYFGEFRGTPDLVYLTLSTGLGAGVVSGGRLVQGARDLGGEVGHHVMDPNGPPCPCGLRGCWEVYCGGRNVAERFRERLANGAHSRALELAGGDPDRLEFRHIADAARTGDPLALEFWNEFVERLAHGIGTVLMFYNPSVVILGTIAIHTGDFLLTPLRAAVARYAWPVSREGVRIAASALGASIGDLAALAVAVAGLESRSCT